jgi:hypothetical protein
MRTENKLIQIAEMHPDGKVANKAMKELRERFDPTYMWCMDCDGLVVKERLCCMRRKEDEETGNIVDLTDLI